MNLFLKYSVVAILSSHVLAFKYNLTKVTSFPIKYPGFTSLYEIFDNTGDSSKYDLLISTFDPVPFSTDTVQIVPDVGKHLLSNSSNIIPKIVTTKVTWPNEISGVPRSVFNKTMVAIPDGFLVPFKTDGSISLVDIDGKGPYKLTDDQTGKWFYHRVVWKDMDLDGDLDILTCRAREPVIGIGKDSEMLWLENPGNYYTPWRPTVIAHGPDIFVIDAVFNTTDGPRDCLIAAQFFTSSLTIYWVDNKIANWTDVSKIKSRVIDNSIGNVFDVTVADLNNDGKPDLLVTNNGESGSLYAYEVPSDFRSGDFKRHSLAAGFKPGKSGTGKGAPGAAMPVYPNTKVNASKPSILLSGDDDGKAYYLEPLSNEPSDWTYSMMMFLDAGDGTVGELSFADVDGDSFVEVFAPSYSTNELYVYRFT
ncbi:uncharacterized protein LOC127706175 isoform X1 [Mytilus californianus]|uniref:uncharacterized protein LOC127706175 isoform X1 n=2 Tax=Mytilus californianus TaxID=6549 RepID=UPI002246510C|nr:uncharacterized protein LOC127706175 isoform X1 [Mytilus californianus]